MGANARSASGAGPATTASTRPSRSWSSAMPPGSETTWSSTPGRARRYAAVRSSGRVSAALASTASLSAPAAPRAKRSASPSIAAHASTACLAWGYIAHARSVGRTPRGMRVNSGPSSPSSWEIALLTAWRDTNSSRAASVSDPVSYTRANRESLRISMRSSRPLVAGQCSMEGWAERGSAMSGPAAPTNPAGMRAWAVVDLVDFAPSARSPRKAGQKANECVRRRRARTALPRTCFVKCQVEGAPLLPPQARRPGRTPSWHALAGFLTSTFPESRIRRPFDRRRRPFPTPHGSSLVTISAPEVVVCALPNPKGGVGLTIPLTVGQQTPYARPGRAPAPFVRPPRPHAHPEP